MSKITPPTTGNWEKKFEEKVEEWESQMIDPDGMHGGISADWHEVKDFIRELLASSPTPTSGKEELDHCQACNGDGRWHQAGTVEHPSMKAPPLEHPSPPDFTYTLEKK